MQSPLFLIALAGGSGRRLADFVRRCECHELPKQFCSFGRRRSLLQETIERTRKLIPDENVVVVVDEKMVSLGTRQLRAYRGARVVAQPCDRGTAAGVLLPLSHVLWRCPDALVVVTPTDHGVRDQLAYGRAIQAAVRAVRTRVADPILFGVEADVPRSDYGWIVPARKARLSDVAAFVEKPAQAGARQLLAAGALWNTMILVARAETLRLICARLLPDLAGLFDVAGRLTGEKRKDFLRSRYESIARADFSHDVLGRARGLSVMRLPREVGWTDVGTPERLTTWLESPQGSARGLSV